MKRSLNLVSAGAMITVVAIIGITLNPKLAVAQQKTINTPDLVRNVDEPGFNSFQVRGTMFATGNTGSVSLPIPSGKVAVIEFVSAAGSLEPGGLINAFVSCSEGANQVAHTLLLTAQGSLDGSNRWVISQPVKCYATTQTSTSGGLVIGLNTTTFNVGSHAWIVGVSGYLVPQ